MKRERMPSNGICDPKRRPRFMKISKAMTKKIIFDETFLRSPHVDAHDVIVYSIVHSLPMPVRKISQTEAKEILFQNFEELQER